MNTIIEKISDLLCKEGYVHYLGEDMNGSNIHHFLNGGKVISICIDENLDEDSIEEILQLPMMKASVLLQNSVQ